MRRAVVVGSGSLKLLALAGCDRSRGRRDRDRSQNRRSHDQRSRAADLGGSSGNRGGSCGDPLRKSSMKADGRYGSIRGSPSGGRRQILS